MSTIAVIWIPSVKGIISWSIIAGRGWGIPIKETLPLKVRVAVPLKAIKWRGLGISISKSVIIWVPSWYRGLVAIVVVALKFFQASIAII